LTIGGLTVLFTYQTPGRPVGRRRRCVLFRKDRRISSPCCPPALSHHGTVSISSRRQPSIAPIAGRPCRCGSGSSWSFPKGKSTSICAPGAGPRWETRWTSPGVGVFPGTEPVFPGSGESGADLCMNLRQPRRAFLCYV